MRSLLNAIHRSVSGSSFHESRDGYPVLNVRSEVRLLERGGVLVPVTTSLWVKNGYLRLASLVTDITSVIGEDCGYMTARLNAEYRLKFTQQEFVHPLLGRDCVSIFANTEIPLLSEAAVDLVVKTVVEELEVHAMTVASINQESWTLYEQSKTTYHC